MKNAINIVCSQESKDHFDIKFLHLSLAVLVLERRYFVHLLKIHPVKERLIFHQSREMWDVVLCVTFVIVIFSFEQNGV